MIVLKNNGQFSSQSCFGQPYVYYTTLRDQGLLGGETIYYQFQGLSF